MAVPGNLADEWINETDRREWVHDGKLWVERPFKDRLVGHRIGFDLNRTKIANGSTWQDMVHTRVGFYKVRDDTSLRFSGYFGAFSSAGVGRAYTSVWVNQTQAGGDPPPDEEIAGHCYFHDLHHKCIPVNMTLSRGKQPNAGNHSADIMVMSLGANFTLEYNADDWWALSVWEVGVT